MIVLLSNIFICLCVIVVLILIYEVFFNTQRNKLRSELCNIYGHRNTIDVLHYDKKGNLYVKCNKCERCLTQLPLGYKRTL